MRSLVAVRIFLVERFFRIGEIVKWLNGKSNAKNTYVMLKTDYGKNALRKTRVYNWFSCFMIRNEDQPRSGRPWTSRADKNVEKVHILRRTIDYLCEMSGLLIERILSEDLNFKLAPDDQRERRLNQLNEDLAFSPVINHGAMGKTP